MNWYFGQLIFRIYTEKGKSVQFDEQYRIICAESREEAFLKARAIGLREEECLLYSNSDVKWEFINVADLLPIELKDGQEIFSQTREVEEDTSYIKFIHQKAVSIRLESILN